jgi:hypothetical protein
LGYVTRALFSGCSPELRDFFSVWFLFSSHALEETTNDGEVTPCYSITRDPGIRLVLHHLRPITEVSAFFTGVATAAQDPTEPEPFDMRSAGLAAWL